MSVVIYLKNDPWFTNQLKLKYQESERLVKFADIHLLYEEEGRYPVNYLRNIALQYARTRYVISLDVDFIPNPDMHEQLREAASRLDNSQKKEALVVPAFEVPSGAYPNSKPQMLEMMGRNTAYQVHLYKGIHAHQPTDYARWSSATEPYEVFYEYSYEPYYVIKRSDCPLFDERFIGYGNDKSSHTYELAANNFAFTVLPDSFIIHKDHPEPNWRADQGSIESWRRWSDFTNDMKWKYGFEFPVPYWLRISCAQGDCPAFWEWST
jgi:hypothetical protein